MVLQATRSGSRWMQTAGLSVPSVSTLAFLSTDGSIPWWMAVGGVVSIAAGLRQLWQSMQFDDQGVIIRRRPGEERVAWRDIDRIEVQWLRRSDGGRVGWRASQPLIERTDGRRVRSQVLGDLVRDGRSDERHAVSNLLAERAAEHGFELAIHGPGAEGTRPSD